MSWLRWLLIGMILATPACGDQAAATRPGMPVSLERDVRTDPPVRFYVVTVDLTDPRVHLKVSRGGGSEKLPRPWEAQLMTVQQMAERDGLYVAVNGNLFQAKGSENLIGRKMPYFYGNWARASGWAMSDGVLFSPAPRDITWPSLVVNDRGQVWIGQLQRVPIGARQIVSGIWQIVTDGQISVGEESNPPKLAPETAVGIDREGKRLILFVVDGRRPDKSAGMSWNQVAREMALRGVWNALLLDGGGSSTLVMRNAAGKAELISLPSDGHDLPIALSVQRCVANAFGVIVDGAATQP